MGIPKKFLSKDRDQFLTIRKMLKFVVALLFLAGASQAQNLEKGLLCDICVDVVTDLDEWLTSDATMDEILKFVEGLCSALGAIDPTLEALCVSLIEAQCPRSSTAWCRTTSTPARSAPPSGPAPLPPPPPPRPVRTTSLSDFSN